MSTQINFNANFICNSILKMFDIKGWESAIAIIDHQEKIFF